VLLDPEDNVITLPDHHETKCVCHVNMLEYHERDPRLDPWERVGQLKHITKFDIAAGCWHESLEGDPVQTNCCSGTVSCHTTHNKQYSEH